MKIRIRDKLFATLLLTSAIVAAGLFFFLQWSFDRGFLNYVKSQELEQLDRQAVQLSGYYANNGSWNFIAKNHPLWQKIHRDTSPLPSVEERDGHEEKAVFPQYRSLPPQGILPPRAPRDLGPRIVLFDADRKWIIGGPSGEGMGTNLTLRPITLEGKVIGYLGLIPFKELSHSGDLLFVEQQTESFVLITTVMVGLSLLLTFPVTIHLLRPINSLTEGTRQLIAGHFKTRIPVTTGDELGRLSDDFNILAETLEKNENNRQLWVADISHELRTPLAVLRGEVEALQDGIRRPEPDTIAALHGEIIHLERIVNDLYELSMSDIGALNYKRVAVNPVGILAGTIELFEQRVSQKGLKLLTELDEGDSCSLLADPDRLQQLFTNLLENSLRYTDSPGKIEVKGAFDSDMVSISFQDSSPGVSPGQLPKLFDRLYRGEGSRNRATGGAGLGLAICKNIVDAHQGRIEAGCSPLGGVLIKIEFPLIKSS
ncbi:MAG: HAMP domain-containing protein [Proteobacteria bacterium]|nr:HAMP domain-containing protein [Pseudomonadota bacterium]MBU1057408.1 HAMP domain-containing protein [Pseudomonadota bacterium]